MAAGGNTANITLGPGRLYTAPVGTSEPASASAALPSAWRAIGYTEDGTTFTMNLTNSPVIVAEEVDPVRYVLSARASSLAVKMAEMTRQNLALAMGSGFQLNDAEAFEPPDPGSEVAVMLVWDKDETPSASNARWLFRQAKVNGSVAVQFAKSPQKALLPVVFDLEKPPSLAPFKVYPSSTGII